ncbi:MULTISPECIES: glycine cleavage system aminomethyltransferase GcvT [Filomicrobium]|uniref:aminomethyltransferase n=1 Tax=Filomicrobium insigne TaxID=418854 RepID=A0A1H0JG50_9HYPH|nr:MULTISPECIES: glycine cleavage system aminomethyltransferase GcvT [Filomicrobium]MCV0370443.1 glycine cleavage system aminomethyltransferase GcvT [Filomicrobium sp.]SDO42562.1 aminomethyltransferase [Filomicrobium insigne]
MSDDSVETEELKITPLYDLHIELGGHMAEFAGYDMPLHFGNGLLKEHLHTRTQAGLFDISHMGQIRIRPKSGHMADAAEALERLVPADIAGLSVGQMRYCLFTNSRGRILDDFLVIHGGDHFLLVTNSGRKSADEAYLQQHISDECSIEPLDRGLIALQGPEAEVALSDVAPRCAELRFREAAEFEILGASCVVSRSGYTGEDGFEISVPADRAREIAEALLEHEAVAPIGLGARNSLRLEAGLCLYGCDIDETTTPVEAGLSWAIAKCRRPGGTRPAGFPGSDVILQQLENGTGRRRVGLRPLGRTPLRTGALLVAEEEDELAVGNVTSGGFGPSLGGAPISMAYVDASFAVPGAGVVAEVRGQFLPAMVVELPFVAPHYRRGNGNSLRSK